jgi:chaperonin cofactor prefoldin
MTKELINLRIQDLIARGKQLEQELQQINGALQQCQLTLSELEKSDAETRQADSPQDNG